MDPRAAEWGNKKNVEKVKRSVASMLMEYRHCVAF